MIQQTPPSQGYLDGFHAAIKQARACVQRELSAYNLTKDKPNDKEATQRGVLLSVDTAIQETKPL